MKPLISIGIPTYEMSGYGVNYLNELFNSINIQTFNDFEVIISDHSIDSKIKNFVKSSNFNFKINYFENQIMRGNPSSNINKIIEESKGDYIKFIFQDDLLDGEDSLENLVSEINLNKNTKWFLSGSSHLRGETRINYLTPYYNEKIHLGYNTISSPSVLTVKNDQETIKFNDEFIWLLDCVYYKECYLKFGQPTIINKFLIINRLSETQLTNHLSFKVKYYEIFRSINKYDKGVLKILRLLEMNFNFLVESIIKLKRSVKLR
jgi:glycosyltransferase involved in cell wall biosynthesis